jgi:hypothetical protein
MHGCFIHDAQRTSFIHANGPKMTTEIENHPIPLNLMQFVEYLRTLTRRGNMAEIARQTGLDHVRITMFARGVSNPPAEFIDRLARHVYPDYKVIPGPVVVPPPTNKGMKALDVRTGQH